MSVRNCIAGGLVATLALCLSGCATAKPETKYACMECPTGFSAREAAKQATAAANGLAMRVVAQRSTKNPLVALRVVVQVGSAHDPPGKEGLAALTAQMIASGGTKTRSYTEILNALYPMAASVGNYVSKEHTVLYGTIHRDNLQAFSALLREQLLTPAFNAEDLKRLKQKARDYVTKTLRSGDDEELGKHGLSSLMYAGHPYAHPTAGTAAGLDAITVDDVSKFYQQHYRQDRLVLGVAGGFPNGWDFTFSRGLQTLPASSAGASVLPAVAVESGRRVQIIEKEARAVAVSMGHSLPITRRDDDFFPLFVAASYLGEHRSFNGVLMQNMRGKRGLNYGDYAYVEAFVQDGRSVLPLPNIGRSQQHFEIWIRPVAPKNAAFSIRQALYEVDKLKREGIPAAGFEDTKAYLMAFSKLWTEDAGRRIGYAIDGKLYGRHIAEELVKRLATMTKADVDKAIAKYLRPEDLRIVAVAGPKHAATLAKTLASGAVSPIIYDTAGTPADVLAEDKIIAKFPLGLSAKTVTVIKAKDLF